MRSMLIAIAVLVAVFGCAGTVVWYALHWVPADFGYGMETEFDSAPPDDQPLADWVRSHPGVYQAAAQRERVGERWRVEVLFGITRNGWGEPRLPDLDAGAAELGYRGSTGPFRHSAR